MNTREWRKHRLDVTAPPAPVTAGQRLIREERLRQITDEGFTAAHDDRHAEGELTGAAYSYQKMARLGGHVPAPVGWPWGAQWWKPSPDPVRNLVKAGALYEAAAGRARRRTDWANAAALDALAQKCAVEIDQLLEVTTTRT